MLALAATRTSPPAREPRQQHPLRRRSSSQPSQPHRNPALGFVAFCWKYDNRPWRVHVGMIVALWRRASMALDRGE
jgi:hypothetical protein